jgi:acetyl esterase/lipase
MALSLGRRGGLALLLAASAAVAGTNDTVSAGLFNRLSAESGVGVERDVSFGPSPRHKLDVYRPVSVPERRPIVMFIYGGGWTSGEKATYAFVGSALAAKGYRTVIADYRLFPEVGFPAFVDDAEAAYRWIAKHQAQEACGGWRPIIVAGHSAGAYIASMLALETRRQLVPQPAALIGLAGPYSFDPTTWPSTRAIFASAAQQPQTARPVNFVTAKAPPTLLQHGSADNTVKPYNTIDLAAALRQHGVAVDHIDYAGVGHVGLVTAIARPLRWHAPVLDDMLRFLARQGGNEILKSACRSPTGAS